MVHLWRCEICGDPSLGESPPDNCPFCGAHKQYIKEARDAKAEFDVPLSEKDKANAERALQLEISNASFYFCASKQTDNPEGKLLFKILGKVEAEHASIWNKILKRDLIEKGNDQCTTENIQNLQESHIRETRAIHFYAKAARESDHTRIKELFNALVEIETDHLHLSEERLKKVGV